jgi:predicted aspartyl protease
MIDTGASGILINSRAADRAGLHRIAAMKFGGVGDSGLQQGYRALAESVRVGSVEFQDYVVDVSDKKAVADEDGLIGMDVFSHFLVTLDFYKQELRLDPLPRHQAKAVEDEPEDREIAPELQSFSPVFRFGHGLLIPTKVSDSKAVLFLIDTGAGSTLISPDFARQVTKVRGEDLVKMKGLSGNVKNVYTADRAVLEFGGYRQNNFDVIAFDLSKISKSFGTEVSGVLGFPALQLFVMKIDYRDGLVRFDYQGPKQ